MQVIDLQDKYNYLYSYHTAKIGKILMINLVFNRVFTRKARKN